VSSRGDFSNLHLLVRETFCLVAAGLPTMIVTNKPYFHATESEMQVRHEVRDSDFELLGGTYSSQTACGVLHLKTSRRAYRRSQQMVSVEHTVQRSRSKSAAQTGRIPSITILEP